MNAVLLVVTGVSLTLAGFMSAIAWRMTREERRRSDARVAELASAIYGDRPDAPPAPPFFVEHAQPSSARYAMVALVGACAVAAIAGAALLTARTSRHSPARTAETRKAPDAPLELLALEHERDGEQLIIRGIVRNPAVAAERDGLTAVVLLIGRDGELISTAREPVPTHKLAPGATTPFVVHAAGAADVDRFRLSFRTDARVEPHVDRRTS